MGTMGAKRINERSGLGSRIGQGLDTSYKSSSHLPVHRAGQFREHMKRWGARTPHSETIPEPLLPDHANVGFLALVKLGGIDHLFGHVVHTSGAQQMRNSDWSLDVFDINAPTVCDFAIDVCSLRDVVDAGDAEHNTGKDRQSVFSCCLDCKR